MLDLTDINALFSLEGALPPPAVQTAHSASALEFLQQIHKRNSDALKLIVQQNGWPTTKTTSEQAACAAFIVILHADYDPQFQRYCHQLMLEEALKGELGLGFMAFLTDRILTNSGKHQRFGTQIREVFNGCFVPKPLEDPDNIDELREFVGLGETLSEYFQRVNDGDFLLYRRLLGSYADELEHIKETKVIPFPSPNQPHGA
jgi:hypothetical protein